jgi:glycine/D-amino acid oxidase-like deaminating enzyme
MGASFAEVEAGSLESDVDLYRFELSHLATHMWPEFERELIDAAGEDIPHGCSKCEIFEGGCFGRGTYVVNNTAADELDDANFDAILQALSDFNEQHELVDPRDIPNYIPEQRFRATRAVYIHGEGWFNPRLMVEKLEAGLRRFPQVSFIDDEVEKLLRPGSLIEGAELKSGEVLEGDQFVLATGSFVTDILRKSELDLPIQPVFHGVGASLELKSTEYPHEKCIRTPNRGWACGIYSVPYFESPDVPNDRILVGATNLLFSEPVSNVRLASIEALMRAAMEQINSKWYRADLVRVNVGSRPTSQDTFPILGRTSIKNLVLATGTNRDGFHLAPVISKRIVSVLMDEIVEEGFHLFAPERKPIVTLTREEAIEASIRHQVSAMYQHDYNPPKGRVTEKIEDMYRADLEKLHDDVGAHDWGIPPAMIDMYRYGHAKGWD